MKKLITLILGVLLICGLCTVAYAAPMYTTSVEGDTLTVVITDAEGKYGDQITLQILAKDKAIDKENPYTDEKIMSDFVYVNQGYLSEEGSFIVNINMEDNKSGNYLVRINGKDMDSIFYATTTDKNNFLRELRRLANGANGDVEVAKKLDLENPESVPVDMFMLNDKYITSVDADFLAKVLVTEIKVNPTCVANADGFVSAINHAAHIAALNEGKGSMEAFGAEFALDESALKVYEEELSKEAKAALVATYYKNKEYTTNKEIEDAFYNAVIASFVNEFDSYGDVKTLIESFGKELEIDTKTIDKLNNKNKTELYQYAAQLTVSDVESFVKKVNDKAKDLYAGQKDSSGSGGGGGGGSSAGIGGGYTPVISVDTTVTTPASVFSDMANHTWAVESVNKLSGLGIVSGVGDGKFEPARNVNREEMITMLIKAYGISTEGAQSTFTDVPASSWYAPYVAAAFSNGYVSGTGEGTFGAGTTITRQDAAVMAYNIAKANGVTFTPTKDMFADDAEIASYAKDAVYALKAKGIINGMGDGSFAPKAYCTRAEAAKIIASLLNQ